MYGLINRALQQLIVSDHGHAVWLRIAERAGWSDPEFVSMENYDDALTFGVVDAAAEELDLSAPELLEALGFFWPRYASSNGYGVLMEMTGETFEEFLGNLDNLHTRIALSYPLIQPPSFLLEKAAPGAWSLRYFSQRPRLAPMVTGILHSLAENFGLTIEIALQETRKEGDEYSTLFEIREQTEQARRVA